MKNLLSNINKKIHKRTYFSLYFATVFLFGGIYYIIGLIIPYIAEKRGQAASSLGFLFTFIGIGNFLGGFLFKIVNKYYHNHDSLFISSLIISGVLLCFYWTQSKIILGFLALVLAIMTSWLEISTNACVVEIGGKAGKNYMQIVYGVYGLGGVLIQIGLSYFKFQSILFMAVLICILSTFYLVIPPHKHEYSIQNAQKTKENTPCKQNMKILPKQLQMLLYIFLFCHISISSPSYSLLPIYSSDMDIASKEQTNLSMSVNFILTTLMRFGMPLINMTVRNNLRFSTFTILFSSITLFFMVQMNQFWLVIHVSSVLYGIGTSNVYPALFALPGQSKFEINNRIISNFTIIVAITYTTSMSLVTFLMYQLNRPYILFYWTMLISVIMTAIWFIYDWKLRNKYSQQTSQFQKVKYA